MDKMELVREIHIGKKNNTIEIKDQIQNKGDKESACMFMYHMNMGYPLLSEHAQLQIIHVMFGLGMNMQGNTFLLGKRFRSRAV